MLSANQTTTNNVKYVGGTSNDQYEIKAVIWKWVIEEFYRNLPVMSEEDHATSNLREGWLINQLISEVGISQIPDIPVTPNIRSSWFGSIKFSVIFVDN